MNNPPRLISDYFKGKRCFQGLLDRSREQAALLVQIRPLIPAPLNAHCTAVVKQENQLVIYVDSSTWASRLRFTTRELTRQLNAIGMKVERVTVRVLVNTKPAKTTRERIRRLTPDNASLINQTAEGIADANLSAALKRLGEHAVKSSTDD